MALLKAFAKPTVIVPNRVMCVCGYKENIGKREIVGFGHNGVPCYMDAEDFPFPSVRWREPTAEIDALREKEKGDWKKLTLEEKKTLYRYSFRRTFAEMNAPDGHWKTVFGATFVLIGCGMWVMYFMKAFVYPDPLIFGFNQPEAIRFRTRRLIDMRYNPITGIASKWDYENNKWK